MSNDFTVQTEGERPLIAAAWRQVKDIRRHPPGSSGLLGGKTGLSLPQDAFPGYQLIEELHRGGQGVVYKALQASTQRHVAIKVLRNNELSTNAEIARFAQEVRVLGRLRHPNIVRIYDSGITAGRFHYVMDYIPGLPLDEYVERAKDSDAATGHGRPDTRLRDGRVQGPAESPRAGRKSKIDEIVRLFVKICDALNAAHVRGIIHRDLKPSNVRVDADGEPFVLDFGLSKLTAKDTSDVTLEGQFVGSLPWAAPEQAEGRIDSIDLRTDVYSLGLLLYNTLTGEFPYRVDCGLTEVLSQIVQADPAPPHTHVPSLGSDLETIILKCLQKDSERRYQTAGELGRDLGRYLNHEPIEARRDSLTYVLGKQLARYRLAAITGAAFVVVVTAFAVVMWIQAQHNRLLAVSEGAARNQAVFAREEAERERDRAKLTTGFLQKMLSSMNPERPTGRVDSLRALLDEASQRVQAEFADQPEVEADVRTTIGLTYQSLGHYPAAEPHLQAAMEIRKQRLGEEHPETLTAVHNWAVLLHDGGRRSDLEPVYRRTLESRQRVLGEEHPDTMSSLDKLAWLLEDQGKLAESEVLKRRALDVRRRVQGIEHPDTLNSLIYLGKLLKKQGKYAEAENTYRAAIEGCRRVLSDGHPNTVFSITSMGALLQAQGRLAEADAYCRDGLELGRRVLGDDHPYTLYSISNLGSLLQAQGKLAEAEVYYRDGLEIVRRKMGFEHPDTLAWISKMGVVLHAQGKPAEAELYVQEALEKSRRILRDEDPDTLAAVVNNIGFVLQARCKPDEVLALLAPAEPAARRLFAGANAMRLGRFLTALGRSRAAIGEFDAAEADLGEAQAITNESPDATHHDGDILAALVDLYDAWHTAEPDSGHDAKAAEWRSRLAVWRASTQPASP